MDSQAGYRFLPWARRGLAAAITKPDTITPTPPVRANIGVTLTIRSTTGNESNTLPPYSPPEGTISLYGPGDIIGIDQRIIVRASPRPGSTDVETNYFAAIEFDPPDFPWTFTPATADTNQRLKPWLVLVVLDKNRVAPPKASQLRPLPTVTIKTEFIAQELPDLTESWAWAHTQMMVDEKNLPTLTDALQDKPDLNVSRLLCPRRLEANHHYIACLVPAFDVGVIRGLGQTPDAKQQNLAPAWSTSSKNDIELPVYYHWEFATGPLGNFESLARRLKPFTCPDTVGVTPMYIGDSSPSITQIDPKNPNPKIVEKGYTMMDGALRAPNRNSDQLRDIDSKIIQQGLREALNAPANFIKAAPSDATPVLGPPIYGQWHTRVHEIGPNTPAWMNELNLDPRARVAAGLGAEVVRRNQEEFMQQAWEQVGEILKAQNQLNWGRLSFEANLRSYEKHFTPLLNDRLIGLTAPLLNRTRDSNSTLMTRLRKSSLPNAVIDPAMRRLLSPQRPKMKALARRLAKDKRLVAGFTQRDSTLIQSLASGQRPVDPTVFIPDGIIGSVTLDRAQSIGANAELDLTALGLPIKVSRDDIAAYQKAVKPLLGRDFQKNPLTITLRDDLNKTGLITRTQIDSLTELNIVSDNPLAAITNLATTIRMVLDISASNTSANGMLITLDKTNKPIIEPLSIDNQGNVLVKNSAGALSQIGSVSPEIATGGARNINPIIANLPIGTFSRTGTVKPIISLDTNNDILLKDTAFDIKTLPDSGLRGTFGMRTIRRLSADVSGTSTPPASTTSNASIRTIRPITLEPIPITLPSPPQPPMLSNTLPMPVTDTQSLTVYTKLMQTIITKLDFNTPIDRGQFVAFNIAAARQSLLNRLNPSIMIPRRMLEMVKVNDGPLNLQDPALSVQITPWFDRIMAAPTLPAPAYKYLSDYDKDRFVPGIGIIPPNSITLLETNPRFIEAFMVGINQEMNNELLWRGFPTDQRGTPFQYFWQWLNGQPDINAIHTWPPTGNLGTHTCGKGLGGQIVMLVRGDLIRRYPNATLLAWQTVKSTSNTGPKLKLIEPANVKKPEFLGRLDPDIIFAGFDLTDENIQEDPGWFFLVQEQPTEPRFGFDQPTELVRPLMRGTTQPSLTKWSDASWSNANVSEGAYLTISKSPLNNKSINNSNLVFGKNAAHIAAICLQQPMRVAIHGRDIVNT